jgi:hypothetical protein
VACVKAIVPCCGGAGNTLGWEKAVEKVIIRSMIKVIFFIGLKV